MCTLIAILLCVLGNFTLTQMIMLFFGGIIVDILISIHDEVKKS